MSVWIEAARPRTLPAALAPVLAGTAAAAPERFVAWRFAAALVVALAVQVAVNYANDYSDGVRGVDLPNRAGPRRAVASGMVAPGRMRAAVAVALGISALAGLALAAAVGWELLVVGLACFLAALGYSGGPRPYASAGLGEVFVFVFFGLVATAGSAYVQAERVVGDAVWAAVPVGLLACAILVVNNLRDVPTDRVAGKATLAVRIGERRSRTLYAALVACAFAWIAVVRLVPTTTLLGLLALPLAAAPVGSVLRGARGRALIPALGATGRVELVVAALLALGFLLAGRGA